MAEFDQTEFEISTDAGTDVAVEVTNARLKPGKVSINSGGGLFIDVEGFEYNLNGVKGSFAGATNQAVVASNTSFVYIDNAGVLQINTTGFPITTVSHFRLATVTTNLTDVTSIIEQRAFQSSGGDILSLVGTQDLDGAYNNGSVITADAGPVDLTGWTTQAPFRVQPQGTAPTVNLADGQIAMISLPGGFPQIAVRDTSRTKWLSANLFQVGFGRNGSVDNAYLRHHQMLDAAAGVKIPFNATIVAVTANSDGGNAGKGFQIRRNGVAASLFSFNLVANQFIDNAVNVDINAGDVLQAFAVGAGPAAVDPVITIWLAWRF